MLLISQMNNKLINSQKEMLLDLIKKITLKGCFIELDRISVQSRNKACFGSIEFDPVK